MDFVQKQSSTDPLTNAPPTRAARLANLASETSKAAGAEHPRLKGTLFFQQNGGRGWDRTSDPYDVNVVLSR